jgi:F-type H+-transporting ATPase subunit alpha
MNPHARSSLNALRQDLATALAPGSPDSGNVGVVAEVLPEAVRVSGLPDCMLGEELLLAGGLRGWAVALEEHHVVCALLDRCEGLRPGDAVQIAGQLIKIPCGTGLLGRIIDPLGRPLDGDGPVPLEELRAAAG